MSGSIGHGDSSRQRLDWSLGIDTVQPQMTDVAQILTGMGDQTWPVPLPLDLPFVPQGTMLPPPRLPVDVNAYAPAPPLGAAPEIHEVPREAVRILHSFHLLPEVQTYLHRIKLLIRFKTDPRSGASAGRARRSLLKAKAESAATTRSSVGEMERCHRKPVHEAESLVGRDHQADGSKIRVQSKASRAPPSSSRRRFPADSLCLYLFNSERMYKDRFKLWRWSKNLPRDKAWWMVNRASERKPKETEFKWGNQVWTVERVLKTHVRVATDPGFSAAGE